MKKTLFTALISLLLISPISASAKMVTFNTETLIYHKPNCKWAKKCTKNCIKIEKKEAIKQGGKPCIKCKG